MNVTLEKLFEAFNQRITLSQQEIDEALERADEICRFLSQATPIQECKITGSMARSTAIRRYSDVDVMAVLHPPSAAEYTPQSITACLLDLLTPRYREARISENTVRIRFTQGPDVDVIPAIQSAENQGIGTTYVIPSPDRSGWDTYNPEERNRHIALKNTQLGNRFIALIRVVKYWSKQNGHPIPSYEIEDIASATFTSHIPSTTRAVVEFFDNVNSSPVVRQKRHTATISTARAIAKKALQCEQQGDTHGAYAHWGSLLGDQFSSVIP